MPRISMPAAEYEYAIRKRQFILSYKHLLRASGFDPKHPYQIDMREAESTGLVWITQDDPPPPPPRVPLFLLSQWHDTTGEVLWWRFPINEPPYVGTPLDTDWPGYHTHFTCYRLPEDPAT